MGNERTSSWFLTFVWINRNMLVIVIIKIKQIRNDRSLNTAQTKTLSDWCAVRFTMYMTIAISISCNSTQKCT